MLCIDVCCGALKEIFRLILEIEYCKKNPCDATGTKECEERFTHRDRKCHCKPGYTGETCKNYQGMSYGYAMNFDKLDFSVSFRVILDHFRNT